MNVARPVSNRRLTRSVVDQAVRGHIVQFYSDDRELVAGVTAHLAMALRSGGAAVAIATEAHRAAFEAGLADLRIGSRDLNRLISIDAEETLQRLMVDGELDGDRFHEVVGELIGFSERPIHAFGEMVAVLWGSGRVQQAIDLETLWNSLGQRHRFVLVCGYPDESCLWSQQSDELAQICTMHDAVTGSAAPPEAHATKLERLSDLERSLSLPRERVSVRSARALVREVFTDCSLAECEVAELLVSELVANALDHGSGDVVVKIVVRDRSVRISVRDDDPNEPRPKNVDASSPRGRGLQIVRALAIDWGVTPTPAGGKVVWVELGRTNLRAVADELPHV